MEAAEPSDIFKCNACGIVKHILAYSPIYCRQFIQGERRAHIWRCTDCQFPKCKLCDARPEIPVSHNHVEADGSWYCLQHRYPPCCVCRKTPRPATAMHSKLKFKDWTCAACKTSRAIASSAEQRNATACTVDRSSELASQEQAEAPTVHGTTYRINDMNTAASAPIIAGASSEDKHFCKDARRKPDLHEGSAATTTSHDVQGKAYPCTECGEMQTKDRFRLRDEKHINRSGRCEACDFLGGL